MGFSTPSVGKANRASPLNSLRSRFRRFSTPSNQACPRGPSPTARAWFAIGSCPFFQANRASPLNSLRSRFRRFSTSTHCVGKNGLPRLVPVLPYLSSHTFLPLFLSPYGQDPASPDIDSFLQFRYCLCLISQAGMRRCIGGAGRLRPALGRRRGPEHVGRPPQPSIKS